MAFVRLPRRCSLSDSSNTNRYLFFGCFFVQCHDRLVFLFCTLILPRSTSLASTVPNGLWPTAVRFSPVAKRQAFTRQIRATLVGARVSLELRCGWRFWSSVERCRVRYITEHSEARVVVCEDENQLKKFLPIRKSLPKVVSFPQKKNFPRLAEKTHAVSLAPQVAYVLYNGSVPAGVNDDEK